jgi:hypothetical protein
MAPEATRDGSLVKLATASVPSFVVNPDEASSSRTSSFVTWAMIQSSFLVGSSRPIASRWIAAGAICTRHP